MKLEIKHLAAYLPYGLKIKILNYKRDYVGIEIAEASGYYQIQSDIYITYVGGSTGKSIDEFKPILRPLSDLKPDKGYETLSLSIIDMDETPYSSVIELISHHYDVFGLIPAGLAIDINTIK